MDNHFSVLSAVKTKILKFNIHKGKNFEFIFKEENDNKNKSAVFDAQKNTENMLIYLIQKSHQRYVCNGQVL